LPVDFSEEVAGKVERFHQQLPGYRPTELVRLRRLAEAWGIKDVFVKDESTRFNLKAFKVLGGSYAVARLMCQKLGMSPDDIDFAYLVSHEARERIGQITLTAARQQPRTGHCLGAASFTKRGHLHAQGRRPLRVENIRIHGATVIVTDLNYDDAVRLSCRMGKKMAG
jgi:diaminopropionate ammonia-lyase